MTPDVDVLLDRARAWAAADPDEATRAELEALIADVEAGADAADLGDRFSGTLEFGTAGLRGALGAGPNRMNRVVVTRAAAGLAAYLREQGATGAVVIGYDARHNSDVFARDTAEVMTGAGFTAHVLPRPLPTPLLAFAIRELGCVAGVMVTASHNPPQDNGYKVYLGDGSQIVPPADAEISRQIAAIGTARRRAARRARHRARRGHRRPLPRHRRRPRRRRAARPAHRLHAPARRGRRVGGAGARDRRVRRAAGRRAAGAAGPGLPDRRFPNPEEPGAMDLAMALAERTDADLVVANDPDADRCAAAVPGLHGWRMLRGDEVGALLAHHLLRAGRKGTYAASIVSSSLLGKQAAAAGQPYVETLTGFKWISRVPDLAFGYEEALGYCVDPEHVPRQGRRLGAADAVRARGAGQGRRPRAHRPPRRHRARARPARHRPAVGAGERPER